MSESKWERKRQRNYIIFNSPISVVLGTEISTINTIEYHMSRSELEWNVRNDAHSESALFSFFFVFLHSSPRRNLYTSFKYVYECVWVSTVYHFTHNHEKNCITYSESQALSTIRESRKKDKKKHQNMHMWMNEKKLKKQTLSRENRKTTTITNEKTEIFDSIWCEQHKHTHTHTVFFYFGIPWRILRITAPVSQYNKKSVVSRF